MPVWPAIIKYADFDEVALVASEEHWRQEAGSGHFRFTDDDVVIDSQGRAYQLLQAGRGSPPALRETDRRLSPRQLSEIVRKHLGALNHCCVGKIEFSDYPACFAMLEQTVEQ